MYETKGGENPSKNRDGKEIQKTECFEFGAGYRLQPEEGARGGDGGLNKGVGGAIEKQATGILER